MGKWAAVLAQSRCSVSWMFTCLGLLGVAYLSMPRFAR
jgi:hypothetical protein